MLYTTDLSTLRELSRVEQSNTGIYDRQVSVGGSSESGSANYRVLLLWAIEIGPLILPI